MELILSNPNQHRIADLLWAAQSMEDMQAIVRANGRDAVVVRDMMLAAFMDEVKETDLARNVLNDIFSKE